MSQFLHYQGTTTKVYPLAILRGGVDAENVEIGHIPDGLRLFSRSASLQLRQGSSLLHFPCRASRIRENLSQRGQEVFSKWVLKDKEQNETPAEGEVGGSA